MELDKSITNKDIREMYPSGTYYLCAANIHDDEEAIVRKVDNSKNILGIMPSRLYVHAEDSRGCLYYKGTWAPICDSKGNLMFENKKEVSYEIY